MVHSEQVRAKMPLKTLCNCNNVKSLIHFISLKSELLKFTQLLFTNQCQFLLSLSIGKSTRKWTTVSQNQHQQKHKNYSPLPSQPQSTKPTF